MARQKKKRIRTARRNLLPVALLVALISALIIASLVLNREVVFILDEDPEVMATRRAAPENAYRVFEEAVKLIPEAPKDAREEHPTLGGKRMIRYHAEKGSWARRFGLHRPDDDPELLAYIRGHGPAFDEARKALDQPYFLWPEPSTLFDHWRSHHGHLILSRLGNFAEFVDAVDGEVRQGILYKMDYLRYHRLLAQDSLRLSSLDAYDLLGGAAIAELSQDDLAFLLDQLVMLGPPYPGAGPLLEARWRVLDNTLTVPPDPAYREFPGSFFTRLAMWRVKGHVRMVAENREQWRRWAEMSPADFLAWPHYSEFRAKGRFLAEHPYQILHAVIAERAQAQLHYFSALFCVALEMHKADHDAYPEELEALVPDYLAGISADPINGEAFGYRQETEGYRLYSLGLDRKDEGGKETEAWRTFSYWPHGRGERAASPPGDILLTVMPWDPPH